MGELELNLDEIMNGSPEPEVIQTPSEPVVPAQPRDERGQFAPKANEAQPEPGAEAQAEVEAELEGGHVPQKALHEERKKRQTAEQTVADMSRQMQELQGQVRLLSERAIQPTQPATPKDQPKPPQLWEDPDAYLRNAIDPINKTVQDRFLATSEMLAVDKHGEDTVTAAGQAMLELAQAGDRSAAVEYQRIMSSKHPYGELVAWHKRHQAMQEIGSDPVAYRERIRQEILAEQQGQQPGAPAAGTPSNPSITKPLTQLPKSLSRLPGGGNAAGEIDASDAGIFASAMAGR